MAKYGVTNIAGGGGVGSDEISVTKEYVLDGRTYVGADTDDEIGTGAMANNGATGNQSLNAGGSFSVKKGYHAQNFTVIANSLASQTSGTAIPTHVFNGETYWTNGNKLTGTMNVQSILSFSCAPYSASQIIFTWQNPYIGPFSGVIIIGKTGGYPTSINDGTRYYKGYGNNTSSGGISNAIIGGFGVNTTYYFRVFSYTTVNGEEWGSGTTRIGNTIITQTTLVFTSSTTWTAPSNTNYIEVFCVGGGGGGGFGGTTTGAGAAGGGGGGGGYTATTTYSNLSNRTFSIVIGGGGSYRTDGSNTIVYNNGSPILTANGGKAGGNGGNFPSTNGNGGNGGSGGGGGCYIASRGYGENAGNGGSDGSDGNKGYGWGGTGQHFTTRVFGAPSATPYSGGGGGGGSGQNSNTVPGDGGYWGGGNASSAYRGGSDGTPNSGGGGGASFPWGGSTQYYPYSGGSGVCIIRYVI